jgi:hypothetical protein
MRWLLTPLVAFLGSFLIASGIEDAVAFLPVVAAIFIAFSCQALLSWLSRSLPTEGPDFASLRKREHGV